MRKHDNGKSKKKRVMEEKKEAGEGIEPEPSTRKKQKITEEKSEAENLGKSAHKKGEGSRSTDDYFFEFIK